MPKDYVMAFNEGILADKRPNFFELVAEEAMHETLRPAIEYICKVAHKTQQASIQWNLFEGTSLVSMATMYSIKVIAHSRPDWFGVMWRARDEFYLLLESVLQWWFLREYDGSFSEYFYCLKRVSDRIEGSSDWLSLKKRLLSLLCLVLVPYLKVKVERLYSILTVENDSSRITWSRGQSVKRLLKFIMFKAVPYLQSLWIASLFIFRLRYLMNKSQYYSPLHWMAGVKMIRQMEDMPPATSLVEWRSLVGQLFSLSLFFLKLVQWWYSGEREAALRKMSALPVPPPPPREQLGPDVIPLLSDQRLCPLCHQIRREPTALSTSGYVFCYDCITDYISSSGRCPLTCFPCSNKQLVRLFIDNQY